MAHPICGIDVGAFSIKFVVFDVGFRQNVFRGAFEEMVVEGETPLIERQMEAVREGLSRVSSDAMLYVAMPGDQLSIRSLELPFGDPRKIDQVIGFELEGQIVHALDEVVFDHVTVRSSDDGSSVLAVAAKQTDVAALLESLRTGGVDPRSLYAAPVAYRALPIDDPRADEESGKVVAILDIGHLRSNLFIGRDRAGIAARTIMRGGHHLTMALAEGLELNHDRAEQFKRTEARLLAAGAPMTGTRDGRPNEIMRATLAPLVREVRQTLAAFRAASHREIGALHLTGGTARLRGIAGFFQDELDLPVGFLSVPNTLQSQDRGAQEVIAKVGNGAVVAVDEAIADLQKTMRLSYAATESSSFALATAIGIAASRGGREIDLRRGPFIYSVSFSALRQKAGHLMLLAATVLVAGGLDVFAALSNLGDEKKALDAHLKTATQEIFGQPRTDAKEVTQLLRKGFKEELAPVPRATAFDLLEQISKKVPSDDDIVLDITELDIRPKKTFIKGTVGSATAVDEIAEKLKDIDCYEDVTKGTVTEVSGDSKQFTLTVASKCP
ncbi:MAG TPA: type II secretion system protein GspL [Polyangia bacterium]|jgi:Tfp pilus assembly PilM family ATPase